MVCPGCSSVIPQIDMEKVAEVIGIPDLSDVRQYEHSCTRCWTRIRVTVLVLQMGPEDLRKKWYDWLRKDVIGAENEIKNQSDGKK